MSQIGLARKAVAKVLRRASGSTNEPEAWLHFPGEQLISILEKDAVPAISAIAKTPGFQQLVCRGVDPLLPGSDSLARKLIGVYQNQVRDCCDAMQAFVDSHQGLLKEHLPVAGSRYMRLLAPRVESPAESLKTVSQRIEAARHASEQEWAWKEDFFGPTHDTLLLCGDKLLQKGEFVVCLSEDLTYVGNHIARCLMVRAATPRRSLQENDGVLNAALIAANCRDHVPWRGYLKAVEGMLQDLRTACLTDSYAVLAESATTLVQILLEFSSRTPEMPWLPVTPSQRGRHAGSLCHALRSRRDAATAERILDALKVVEVWWESRPLTLAVLEEAIATGGLVLDHKKHQIYWRGQLIPIAWSRTPKQWDFLLALARSRGMNDISLDEIYSRNDKVPGNSAISTLKDRVARSLPLELRKKIVPGLEAGTYRLDLQASDIYIV